MGKPRQTQIIRNPDLQPKRRQTLFKKGKPRRAQIIRIPDLQERRQTFSKRRQTLFKKAGELSILTDCDVSVRVRSSTGITYYESYQSGGKLIDSYIARPKGKVNSSTGPREWEEDLVKQEGDACTTKEDLQSVIANREACLAYARERLENWENNPSIKAADSGVKVDCETEETTDKGINSFLKSFGHADDKSFWTLASKWTAGSASDPTSSDLDDWDDLLRLDNSAIGGPSDPMCSGLDDGESNMDELLSFSGLCIGGSYRPENSAIGGPSNPISSGLDDREFSMDELFELAESCIRNVDRRPENSVIGGPSNPTSSGLDDGESNMDELLSFSGLCIGGSYRPENSAIGGPSNPISSGLDDREFSMDELFELAESCIRNVDRRPENSVIGGPSNPTSSGLDDCEFSMDEPFDLAESCVRNGDRPESSTVGGGFNHLDDFPQLENLDVDLDRRGF